MSASKTFYCLRCQHRFQAEHEPKKIVERSCPKCGSNSVRLETAMAAEALRRGREGGLVYAEDGTENSN
ncbi:MAG: zinc ribbon domain-containing protein [Acidobacteriota bacterium]|nr:zinc ribbon domain-containing protein [Acidobacteriota bacterium]